MAEYAIMVAESGLMTMQSFATSAEVWLDHINWKVVGYFALGLIALRVGSWVLRAR
jgi:hypothetical protein